MICFRGDECRELSQSLGREWLETNGLGGFASSTVAGVNTRRYHGLLMAATKPPAERYLLLAKLEETLVIAGQRYELSANQYPGVVHPAGYQYMEEFRLDPFPVFVYRVEGVELQKRLFLVQGENTVAVEYVASGACELEVRPLVAFRGFHELTHANPALRAAVDVSEGMAAITPYEGLPPLHFGHDADEVRPQGNWYFRLTYERERERGLDYEEDLFQPFVLRYSLQGERMRATVIASTEVRRAGEVAVLKDAEVARRAAIRAAAPRQDDALVQDLTAAADQFLARRGEDRTVIAGYHWFGDWGRDTMIALPGLTLVTGRYDVAKSILRAFARYVDQGMLPNWFPGAGETPEYNTVDATLWYFEAVRAYLHYTDDAEFLREVMYPVLQDIVAWHLRGTRFGIHVDPEDGLLFAGEPGVQLTWMDAKVNGQVITPRTGKAVEIQALWYNALQSMASFAKCAGDTRGARTYHDLARRVVKSFLPAFWNVEAGCLYDVVNGAAERDGSIRPNQIFAVSLAHALVRGDQARGVVNVVQRELLTPLGLRTLSPKDARYRPVFGGDPVSRDSAYHQGTIWPWLMGPFITAYLRVNRGSKSAQRQSAAWLQPFSDHLRAAGLGQVSEVASAEPPFTPGGCIAQAWSVAELLRVAVEVS